MSRFSRNDQIGIACALAALGLVAWLSVENQAWDACRTLLKADPAEQAGDPGRVAACRIKLGETAR